MNIEEEKIVNKFLYSRLNEIEQEILDSHPILRYRVKHFAEGINVRGMTSEDSSTCAIVLDDSVIAGSYHFPCVIYMREKGNPIGKVGPNMREERLQWHLTHDCHKDPICSKMCLDVCRDHNRKFKEFHNI